MKVVKLKSLKKLILDNKEFVLLWLAFFLVYAVWSVYRHISFQTDAIDLGIFDQAIWKYSTFQSPLNTIKFNTYPGVNLLSDHFHPILVTLAPLFWFWNDVRLILIAQALLVVIGVIPFYLMSLQKFKSKLLALAISFSYLAFIGIQSLIDYDFHEIAFGLPILGFAIYFLINKKIRWYLSFLFLAFLVKEDMPLYTLMLGVYALLSLRQVKIGLLTITISLVAYYLVTRLFIPSFALGKIETSFLNPTLTNPFFSYEQLDPRLGKTSNDLLKTMVTNPAIVASTALDLGCLNFSSANLGVNSDSCVKLRTILNLMGSFAFLPIIAPLTLLLVVPNLISRFLTTLNQRWIIRFQYNAILAPILTLAVIDAVSNLIFVKNKLKLKFLKDYHVYYFVSALLFLAPVYFTYRNQTMLTRAINPASYKMESRFEVNNQLIKSIPNQASVVAQSAFVPHLTHRDKVYRYTEGVLDIIKADYVLVSTEEHTDPPYTKEVLTNQIEAIRTRADYDTVYWDGARLLLRAKGGTL